MSVFVHDASCCLTWCFPDRSTANADAALKRMKSHLDGAVAPWVWQLEVGDALGEAVVKGRVSMARALEIWDELPPLPIRQAAIGNVPQLMQLAVKHNLSLYDTCYLQAAIVSNPPLAANDQKPRLAAETIGIATLTP